MKKILPAFLLFFSFTTGAQELRYKFNTPGRIENNILFNFRQNPALTGYEECFNLQGGYGIKWMGLPGTEQNGSPQNWYGAFDVSTGKRKINSFGFLFNRNYKGFEKRAEFLIAYSATIRINPISQLRIGLSGGYIQTSINFSELAYGDQVDPTYGFIYSTREIYGRSSRGFTDFNGGMLFSAKRFFLGFSAMHLTQPDNGILGVSRVPIQLNYNAGYYIRISPEFYLTPSFIASNNISYGKSIGSVFSPALSFSLKNRYLLLLNYRNLNTLMVYAGAQLKENLRLTFGWGFATEKELRAIQSGQSLEIMLRYRFKVKNKKDTEEEEKKNENPEKDKEE